MDDSTKHGHASGIWRKIILIGTVILLVFQGLSFVNLHHKSSWRSRCGGGDDDDESVSVSVSSAVNVTSAPNVTDEMIPRDENHTTGLFASEIIQRFPPRDDVIVNRSLCEIDKYGNQEPLSLVAVAQPLPEEKKPKILCYIMTISSFHDTKVKSVMETWASKCTKFFIASNLTDTSIGAVEIPNVRHTWEYLWEKHRETLRYMQEHNMIEGFDWLLKADDNTYVLMENLHAYLTSDEIVSKMHQRPMHLGYHNFHVVDPMKAIPKELRDLWALEFPRKKWYFAHGGSAYLMNQIFLRNVLTILDTRMCLNQESNFHLCEDYAVSFCGSWFPNGKPYRTLDKKGRERFHPYTPAKHYERKGNKKCCSPETISFHEITPELMYYLDAQLHACRKISSKN